MVFMEFLLSGGLDSGGSLFWVCCPLPPLPTVSQEPLEFLTMPQGLPMFNTSRKSRHNAPEGCPGTGKPPSFRLLHLAVSGAKGIEGVASRVLLVESERICHPYQIQN